jgi:hypothetical protein
MNGGGQREAPEELRLTGRIATGGRGASGQATDGVGSVARQIPFFDAQGVPRAKQWFKGTINIDLTPQEFEIMRPNYEVAAAWHPDYPTFEEPFWLVDITLEFHGTHYPAYIYYPRPSAMKVHLDSTMEVLAEPIEGLRYEDQATVIIPEGRVRLKPRAAT